MDSTGLRALLSAAREFPDLKLAGPLQPPVRRLLDLTQTHAILPFEQPSMLDVLAERRSRSATTRFTPAARNSATSPRRARRR